MLLSNVMSLATSKNDFSYAYIHVPDPKESLFQVLQRLHLGIIYHSAMSQ